MHSIYIKALTHHLPISFLLAFHLTFKLPYNRGQQKKSGRNSKATTIVPFPQLCFSRASQQAKPQSHLLHARAHLNEDELTTHTHTHCVTLCPSGSLTHSLALLSTKPCFFSIAYMSLIAHCPTSSTFRTQVSIAYKGIRSPNAKEINQIR